jgi:hypothetical protein
VRDPQRRAQKSIADKRIIKMTNSLESSEPSAHDTEPAQSAGWLKVGVVAAGSALAGGLLAAWWYRRTLNKLRLAEENPQNPEFGIPPEIIEEED